MKYAQIKNNIITNIVVADELMANKMGLMLVHDDVSVGFALIDGKWQPPAAEITPLTIWTVGQFRDLFTVVEQITLDNPMHLPNEIPMFAKMALESFKTDLQTRTEIERNNPRLVFGIALLAQVKLLSPERSVQIVKSLLECDNATAQKLLDTAAEEIMQLLH